MRGDDEHGGERRLGDDVGEGGAAGAVDGVEIVDGEDDPLPAAGCRWRPSRGRVARVLVRAHDRPAQRLGGDEAAVAGRERRPWRRAPRRASASRGRGRLGEEVDEAAPRLGRGGGPVAGGAAVGREAGEIDDGLAERVVADLGPPGIGAGRGR